MKLTELAIKRPAFMTMIFTLLAVLGIYSFMNMGVDMLPKMDWPMVFVSTIYPGAGPKEVETQVSKPIEEALSSLNGLKTVRTFSSENISLAWIEFNMSTDVNTALNDVERKVNEIRMLLPSDIKQPQVSKADMNALPIMRISVTSDMNPQAFYQLIKDRVKPLLEQLEGVATVNIVGGTQREIRIEVDNNKLKSYNLSIGVISQVLTAENLDFPTGKVDEKEKNYIVRVAGKFDNLDQIRNIIIAATPMGTIKLKDVANVIDTYKEDYSVSRLNGKTSIGLIISKASDANSVKASELVRSKLSTIEKELAEYKLKFEVAQDITEFTKDSVNDVMRDLGLAILMVAIVLFLFLHNLKNSLIIMLSIPTSLISAFIMMSILGFTVNVITLMALALVIGILVDDSIVVLENIHRHMERGEDKVTAAIKGRAEIGMAAIAITLVDVVVFLPIAMVSGIVGKIFREFGLTIVVSTLFSLFVSFTLTPMLASRWSKVVHFTKTTLLSRFINWFEGNFKKLENTYRSILEWALDHRKTVILVSAGLLVISISYLPLGLIGTEFMPQIDKGEFAINLEMPLGTNIEKTKDAVLKVEEIIKNTPEVVKYYTNVGMQENTFGSQNKSYYGQIQVKLLPKDKRKPTQEVISKVQAKVKEVPGIKAQVQLIGMFGGADESPIYIEVKGSNLDSLIVASEMVAGVVEKTKGTRDIKSSWEEGQPEVKVIIDRTKCANNSLTLGEVAMTLRTALEGDISTKYKEGDVEYDMRVLLSKENRNNPDDVGNIIIQNRMGKQIKLAEVAEVFYGKGPSQISRKDRSRVINVTANLDNTKPMGEVIQDIKDNIDKLRMPGDSQVFYAGNAEDMNNMFLDMIMAIMFAVLFVYMIMVSLFESFMHPFTIMFSLPVALVGALTGLMLTDQNMNMFSMIGVLLSMGLVTKNAILLVDYTNTLRKEGLSIRDALLTAGPVRLRPIVMTTSTMIFGMLPLAMAMGSGGEMRKGLAIVVIGALLSSTLLTLVLVPVIYTVMEKLRTKFSFFKKKEEKFDIERFKAAEDTSN
jgi:hydrophobic/amphiphilic exporter-1 (mainly G- bacteria), HAE1 family